jgi:reactive intermediate/imine deaminase
MANGFNPPGVVHPFGAFSNAAWAPQGRLLYISGQVAIDESGNIVAKDDFRGQARFALETIGRVLEASGGTFDDIVSVNVFLTDMNDLGVCHEVRRQFFKPPYPASTLVQVAGLVRPELKVEINAVAVIKERASQ